MQQSHDAWQAGSPYEQFMGRWSKEVARDFLNALAVISDRKWLDVGCGTGVLSRAILSAKQPSEVLGIDAAPTFVSFAREHHPDPRLSFKVASAEILPVEADTFDAAVSGLALNFVSQPERAIAEMRRVTKRGGVVAAYVWDYAEGMQMLRYFWDSVIALNEDAAELDEAIRFPLCKEDRLHTLFQTTDLHDLELRSIEVPTIFRSFDDFWQPFLGGVGPAPSYVASLPEEEREELRSYLQAKLPLQEDGTLPLTARAWSIQGTV